MVNRTRRARSGFTLIELTIALVLLAVGLLALVGALARALQETQHARLRLAALRHAESVADSLAIVATAGAGARAAAGLRVEWRAEPCVAGECMRVVARTLTASGDSLALLVRVGTTPNEP
jgi:prepilin-type N-terminal cleavage/methylation domain-containing protein